MNERRRPTTDIILKKDNRIVGVVAMTAPDPRFIEPESLLRSAFEFVRRRELYSQRSSDQKIPVWETLTVAIGPVPFSCDSTSRML